MSNVLPTKIYHGILLYYKVDVHNYPIPLLWSMRFYNNINFMCAQHVGMTYIYIYKSIEVGVVNVVYYIDI